MNDRLPLKTFVRKLSRYYPPITYRKALDWIHAGELPVWPRLGQENFNVRLSLLPRFLEGLGLAEERIQAFLKETL